MKGFRVVVAQGQKFGDITIIRELTAKNKKRMFLCRCKCGAVWTTPLRGLTEGTTKSCGCERTRRLLLMTYKHGFSRSKLYHVWQAMKARCNTESHENYHRYGGRGISVCGEWLDYEVFHGWAIGNGYKDGLTLERVNNDDGYYPGNCEWATRNKQMRNTRRNVCIEYHGEVRTICEWSALLNIPQKRLYGRIYVGWTPEKAIETPFRSPRSTHAY